MSILTLSFFRGNIPRLYATEYTLVSTQPSEETAMGMIRDYRNDVCGRTLAGGGGGATFSRFVAEARKALGKLLTDKTPGRRNATAVNVRTISFLAVPRGSV